MRSPLLRSLLLFLAVPVLPMPGMSAEQCLVVGDSLTKEYETEFPALFPNNPASWWSRNWIEILHKNRTAWFDLGRWSSYADPRLTGHEHNWAFPGATTTEIRTQVTSIFSFLWVSELKGQIQNAVERVVIFAGGNDVDSYYPNIYNGATAAAYTNVTRDNIQWMVDYVRGIKSSLPIVLVSVPHLGCSPKMQIQCPTDAVKTARVTATLDSLNAQLASFAQARNIGFVPEVYEFTKAMISQPFRIGGIEMYPLGDPDARPRYAFGGDAFHPATCAHAKIAQFVINAFRTKYPAAAITPLSDSEIVSGILNLDPNLPFQEWIATQGVPANQTTLDADPDGDGLKNLLEFSLEGLAAGVADASKLAAPVLEFAGPQQQPALRWNYKLNAIAKEWGTSLQPQSSTNLVEWTDVPASQLTTEADGSMTVRLPGVERTFLRLRAIR